MKKKGMSLKIISLISVGIASSIVIINFALFSKNVKIFPMLNFFSIVIALGIPLMVKYTEIKKNREIEKYFPIFLRDIADSIETGMTLPQAIRSVANNDYGLLSQYVKEMAAKVEWGISFEKILETFAEKVNSPVIKRSIKTVIETHRSGGKISTVLSAVAQTQDIIERVKKERASNVYAQMINGYVIFFVFLGIMFGLSKFLIPSFHSSTFQENLAPVYIGIFRNLVIIEGIFSGLAIGKMAEGSIFSGIKHSLVLSTLGFTIFTLL